MRRGDLWLGTVVHRDDAGTVAICETVIEGAGLAMEIGRLRVEVRRRLAEVEGSRTRIVTAAWRSAGGSSATSTTERNSGWSRSGWICAICRTSSTPGRPCRTSWTTRCGELAEAIRELRALAQGVRPSALDAGLAAALRELAAQNAGADGDGGRASGSPTRSRRRPTSSSARRSPTRVKHGVRAGSSATARPGQRSSSWSPSPTTKWRAVALPGRGLAGIGDRLAALGRHSGSPARQWRDEGLGGAAMRVVDRRGPGPVAGRPRAPVRGGWARRRRPGRPTGRPSGGEVDHRPDLVVVDIRMPPRFTDEGIQAAAWIRRAPS